MTDIGKILIVIGLGITALGVLLWLAGRSGVPLGHLPGDININRPGFKLYFPVATCLILSGVLSFILWLLHKR